MAVISKWSQEKEDEPGKRVGNRRHLGVLRMTPSSSNFLSYRVLLLFITILLLFLIFFIIIFIIIVYYRSVWFYHLSSCESKFLSVLFTRNIARNILSLMFLCVWVSVRGCLNGCLDALIGCVDGLIFNIQVLDN